MRNLKKVLSLSLALVMLLGMMVVGAGAAAFDDVADGADKQEAIEVMNAIEIIKGDAESGDFRPTDTLTRAEAAVIISKVLFTPAVVEKLVGMDTTFTDMAGYEWAIPYVQACANSQVINGTGDNKFEPGREVTGVEFAAMLMRVLGINDSQFTNWAFEVQQKAIEMKLDTNGVVISAADLNREDAAQMAFNALMYSATGEGKEFVVKSSDGTEELYRGTNETLAMAAVLGNAGAKLSEVTVAAKDSLAQTRFKLTVGTAGTDTFGRDTKVWNVNGKKAVELALGGAPVATYTKGGVTADEVKKATGASNDSVAADKIYINGVKQTGAAKSISSNLCGNGKTVEVYASNKTITKVVVIAPTVATLSADPVTRTNNGKEQVRIPGIMGAWTETSKVSGWEGLTKGDVVLYVKDGKDNYTIEMADTITGTVQGYNSTKGVQVGGVYYPASNVTNAGTPLSVWSGANPDFKDEYTFYLDASGAVVKAVKGDGSSVSAESNYAVVREVAWFPGSGFTPNGYMQAKILKTDGTYETVNVSSVDGVVPVEGGILVENLTTDGFAVKAATQTLASVGASTYTGAHTAVSTGSTKVVAGEYWTTATAAGTSTANAAAHKYYGATNSNLTGSAAALIVLDQFYAYTVDGNGNYALTNLAASSASKTQEFGKTLAANALKQGAAKFDSVTIGNASTVFLFDNGKDKAPDIYTGIANVPSTAAAPSNNTGNAIVMTKDEVAKFVFVKGVTVQNTSTDVVYIADASYTATANGKVVSAFVNGEPDEITLASNVTPEVGLYTVASVNDKGVSTLSSAITMGVGIKTNAGGVMETIQDACATAGKKIFTTNDETVVYVIEGTGDRATCTPMTAADIEADSNDKIWVFLAPGTTTDLAGTIYVLKQEIARPALTVAGGTNGVDTAPTFASDGTASVAVTTSKTDIKITNPTDGSGYTYKVALAGTALDSPVSEYTSQDDITLKIPTDAEHPLTLTVTVTVTDDNNANIVEVFTYTLTVTKAA